MISSWLSSLWRPASQPPGAAPHPSAPLEQQPPPPTLQPRPSPPAQDVRHSPSDTEQPQHQPRLPPHSYFTPRSYKQLSLFLAGATFLGLTTAVTRRSVVRKIKAAAPRYFHPSYVPAEGGAAALPKADSAEGTLFALEALGLATLNTFSFGIMAAGGLAWAFDISGLDDLRARARKHQRSRRTQGEMAEGDEEAEDTIEEWMASVLGRNEGEGKEERDAKEWMARLLVKAKDKGAAEEEGKN